MNIECRDFQLNVVVGRDDVVTVVSRGIESGEAESSGPTVKEFLDPPRGVADGESAAVGHGLFRLLGEAVNACWKREIDAARTSVPARRMIRLSIGYADQRLHAVPWELLHDGREFIGTGCCSTLVRSLRMECPRRAAARAGPLRVVYSGVKGALHPLAVDVESSVLGKSLHAAFGPMNVHFHPVIAPDARRLLHAIRSFDEPIHVWHHAGHGVLSRAGSFSLEVADDVCGTVESQMLVDAVNARPELRLVVVNTCWSASQHGLATDLALLNVPAVVGYRTLIGDDAALRFTYAFYRALAHGRLDLAMRDGRLALLSGGNPHTAANAVLFLRALDAEHLFGGAEPGGRRA